MNISIPQQVEDQLREGERVVGYMKNLFQDEIFFTKHGCSTKDGCTNFIFHQNNSYEREAIEKGFSTSALTKPEILFIKAFIWN